MQQLRYYIALGTILTNVIEGVSIYAYIQNNCDIAHDNAPYSQCSPFPAGACCVFPPQYTIRAVYLGLFPLPGGVGVWFDPDRGHTTCGKGRKVDGRSDSVCLVDDDPYSYLITGGGAAWWPINAFDSSEFQRYTNRPIVKSSKLKNSDFLKQVYAKHAHGSHRGADARVRRNESSTSTFVEVGESNETTIEDSHLSTEDLLQVLETEPALQCQEKQYADIFGWETNSTGVWVLENPSKDQYDRLASFPKTNDHMALNGYLAAVGAKHYDSYVEHPTLLSLMNNVNGSISPGIHFNDWQRC